MTSREKEDPFSRIEDRNNKTTGSGDQEDSNLRSDKSDIWIKTGMLAVILMPPSVMTLYSYNFSGTTPQYWLKLAAVIILTLCMPLLAYSYFFFKKEKRILEVNRIIGKVDSEADKTYLEGYKNINSGPHFILAVFISTIISAAGLLVLFHGHEIGVDLIEPIKMGEQDFPEQGSMLVFGMAFLGSYLWSLRYIMRRYTVNDLNPGAFYNSGIRMIVASTIAFLIFNAYGALPGADFDAGSATNNAVAVNVWPAMAFLIGMFPQRGMHWLMSRIPVFSPKKDPSVREFPLEMIEGIDIYDRMRLEELAIESCHDLETADLIPLVLNTSYGARELADWILQAKLIKYCGEGIKDLRQRGILSISDLADIDENSGEIQRIAADTTVTELSIRQARKELEDYETKRLMKFAVTFSRYADSR